MCRSKHLSLIVLLAILALLLFYLGDLPWLDSSLLESPFFTSQTYHEFCLLILIVPVVWAAFTFRVRGGIVASILVSLAIVPHALRFSPYPDPLFRLAAFTLISLLLAGLIGREINSKAELQRQQGRLERFLSQTIDAQERERCYLARELHDESAQALIDISHEIDELLEAKNTARAVTEGKLRQLRSDVDAILEGTRRFIRGLRPPLLEEMGLGTALKWLANELVDELGIEVHVDLQDQEGRLPEFQELNIFRIVQESLTNSKKHSQASNVWLSLVRLDNNIRLQIADDGTGFAIPTQDNLVSEGQFGLIGIGERARMAGGTFRIESKPGNGTVLSIEIPVRATE